MHQYLYEADLVRIGVIAGVVVSALLYERFHLTTGGGIVPGYLALFILAPLAIVVTLVTAYLTFRIVNGPLAGRMILYGRRKFEMEVLVGLAFVAVLYIVAQLQLGLPPVATAVYGIGFVLPGLIAHDMFRQGPAKTVAVLAGAIAIVAVVLSLFVLLANIEPPRGVLAIGPSDRGYDVGLLLPAVVVSVLAGLAIFRKLGLRSGGFVTAAYLAFVAPELRDLAFAVIIALLTYFIVTRLLATRLLLFGRRKVAMMILVSATLAWSAEVLVVWVTGGAYQPWHGLNAITLMVPALLANDAERQGVERSLWGATLATLAVIAAMNFLAAGIAAVQATSVASP
jgi:poly-gamma-glutamate biosynthesis protein PgsC/CapC